MMSSLYPIPPSAPPPGGAAANASQEGGRRHVGVLPMHTLLQPGDHLVSDNGLFFAVLQDDGDFCVYRGIGADHHNGALWRTHRPAYPAAPTKPASGYFALLQGDGNFCIYRGADLAHNDGWHWGTQVTGAGGQFYAALQDDGNFCIRNGASPDDSGALLWSSGATDRVLRIDEILHIEYDLEAARVLRTSPASLYSETLNNTGVRNHSHALAGSVTVTETAGWTDAFAIRHGACTRFEPGVPVVAGNSVVLSEARAMTYIWNGASTTTKEWGYSSEVLLAPGTSLRAVVSATYSTIVVPYTLIGQLTFESGAQATGTVKGAYMGCNAHDLTLTLTPLHAKAAGQERISQALTPLLLG